MEWVDGLKGTAFEPEYVFLVAVIALVIWLLTKDSDKENEKRIKEKKARRQKEIDDYLNKKELEAMDWLNDFRDH